MGPIRKSLAWKFFDKVDDKMSKCKLCQKNIRSAGNTTNLMGHIRNVHRASYLQISQTSTTSVSSVKTALSTSTNSSNCESAPSTSLSKNPLSTITEILNISNDTEAEIPQLKRQKTIESSFGEIYAYSSTGDKTRKITNALIYMLCKDNQPFSIVENEGFRHLLKIISPQYNIPSRATLTRYLDDKYDTLAAVFKLKLSTIEHITLTTDIWCDSMNMKSFLGVTAHFGIDIELYSVTLGIYESNQRHTSEYIAEMLTNTCQEWGIKGEKISAVVTDNAANMIKAVDLAFGKRKHIPCFAHTLNLVAQTILQCSDLNHIVTKMKAIVTWFKQSCIASDELRKATNKETKLIQDVPTRWNSTYYMMQRFLDLRSIINDILFRHLSAPPMLTALELSTVSSVIQILRPLEAATKEVSGDKYCTSSKIIPLVHCMISKIKPLVFEERTARSIQMLVLREIDKRMGAIEQVTCLAVATILDPRFKKIHFNDPIACSNAVSKIKDIIKSNLENYESTDTESDHSDKTEENFCLWSDHHKLVHHNWKSNKTEGSVSDELSIYLRSPVGRLNENPLEIWNDLQIQFPKLYKIAFKYLTIVSTSVPSERLFSKASQILNQQRNRLKGKRLNKILFLQSLEKQHWDL